MTDTREHIPRLAEDDGLKTAAEFLLAEFNALQNRAVALANNQLSRVNFLLILVAATLAGLGQVVNTPPLQPYLSSIILIASLGILLIGLFTLRNNIDDAGASVILFRRAGRIRLWFVEQSPQIARYVAFEYGDDRPKVDVPFLSFRGGEAVVLLINALAFCTVIVAMTIAIMPFSKLVYTIEVVVAFIVAWIGQSYYIHKVLQKGEKRSASRVKFPYEDMRRKYEQP